MHQHPEIGAQILILSPHLGGAAKIVRHHHERFDGRGYPDHLAGDAIPLGARILSVVDSFSAMIDRRACKEPRSPQAIKELQRNAGTQFDPHIVQLFIELFPHSQPNDERNGNAASIPSPVHDHPAPQPGIAADIPAAPERQPTKDSVSSAA
jgi:response regulator RpfG family c-di-GMP phosphodiesterase